MKKQNQFTQEDMLQKGASIQRTVDKYAKKGKLRRIIALLSAFVLFLTMNQLKFQADTLERRASCGYVEHLHTAECYSEDGTLICGMVEHEHTDACYQQRPPKPEPTVFDDYIDLDSQVVLYSASDDTGGSVSVENVDAAVSETNVELGGSEGSSDSDNGLEAVYDLDDIYHEDQMADDVIVAAGDDEADQMASTDATENTDAIENNEAAESAVEYTMAGSVAFLSDVLKASSIISVGEVVDDALLSDGEHITVEPVEGVADEYVIRVVKDFDRIEIGILTEDDLITAWLLNGVATVEETAPEEVVADDNTSDGAMDADGQANGESTEENEQIGNTNETIVNSNETTETESKQTEVGEEEGEVGEQIEDVDASDDVQTGETASSDDEVTNESVTDETATDETVTDETVTDETVTDETVTDETVTDETVTDETVTNETVTDETVIDETVTDETVTDETVTNETVTDETVIDETVTDETVTDETVTDETVTDETVTDETVTDETVTDETVTDETVTDETVTDETVTDETVADETVTDETVIDETVTDETVTDETVTDETVTDELVTDETVTDETVTDETVTDETVTDETVTDETVTDETVTDETVTDETVTDETVTDDTTTDENVTDETVTDETVTDETVTDEIATDETVTDETMTDETVTDETVTDETVTDETVTDETVTDETVTDETSTDETVTDETVTDETVTDETITDETVTDETITDEMQADDDAADAPAAPGEAQAQVVTLDFTDYIATDDHTVYLYDSAMVAVLVSANEIGDADGVTAAMGEQPEDAADGEPAALIITGDGEYELNGVTYVVTGLVLPKASVEGSDITITTANEEATLLNVAPVFEETDEDYDDIFSLFAAAQEDPTLLAKVADVLFGVAYAEESEERDLTVRIFNITLQDLNTGEAVDAGTELHVETLLEHPIEGEDFALYHIADGKAQLIEDAVVVEDGKAVGLNFNTVSLDKFALVYYTVKVVVNDKAIDVSVDFEEINKNGVDFDNQTILTALNDGVGIEVGALINGGDAGDLIVEASEASEGFEAADVDLAALRVVSAEGGVEYAEGSIRVTGDGSVTLTDDVYTVAIHVTNYSALAKKVLGDGVIIDVLDGEVPMGASATYTDLSDQAGDMAAQYGLSEDAAPEAGEDEAAGDETAEDGEAPEGEQGGEPADEAQGGETDQEDKNIQTETAVGFSAFDVGIAMPDGEVAAEGSFDVTVPHAIDVQGLLPEGAELVGVTYELFHIHEVDGEMVAQSLGAPEVDPEEGEISFNTDGFSEYLIKYTVEFHNGDEEIVIRGGSQVLLSTLIADLHLVRANNEPFTVDEVEKVEFDDEALFTVEKVTESPVLVNGEEVELIAAHDFLITSKAPFDATNMRLTLIDGEVIVVETTDDQPFSVTLQFVQDDEGHTPVSETGLTGEYYVLVRAKVNNQDMYSVSNSSFDLSQIPTEPVTFTYFYKNDGTNQTPGSYSDGDPIGAAWLVSKTSGNDKPNVYQAYDPTNSRSGVVQIPMNSVLGSYVLSGAPNAGNAANYIITATKKQPYTVVSSFSDEGTLSDEYYLVAKTTVEQYGNSVDKYYVDVYNPSVRTEIIQFEQGQYNPNPTSYSPGMNVDVWLVKKTSSMHSPWEALNGTPIGDGDSVEQYNLAVSSDIGNGQTTFTFTASSDVFVSTVKFYGYDATVVGDTPEERHVADNVLTVAPDDLTKHYYLLATIRNGGTLAGWAVNRINLNNNAETSTSFREFYPCNSTGAVTQGAAMIPFTASGFNYTIETRLLHTDNNIDDSNLTYQYLVTDASTNGVIVKPEDGYEYAGNWNRDDAHNEIHLKKAYAKSYAVRVRFVADDIGDLTAINSSDCYYVFLKIEHRSGDPSYQYELLTADNFSGMSTDSGYPYVDIEFDHWLNQNGENIADSFTGNEASISVLLIKVPSNETIKPNTTNNTTTAKYAEGESMGPYVVHYDTKATNPQSSGSGHHEVTDDEAHETKCYDLIDLSIQVAEGEYDYASILGPNYIYGIVADHLYHNNDLQTNFAVNHYTGHGDYATPDLSGSSSGAIVIGEFNRNTDVMSSNHVGVPVNPSEVNDDNVKAGTLPIGNNVKGVLAVYVDNNTGIDYNGTGYPVKDTSNKAVIQRVDGQTLMDDIVKPGIQYGINVSNALASKEASFTPAIPQDGKPIVDTTGFPDGATIYIDADRLLDGGVTADGVYGPLYTLKNLKIRKLDNQVIVFNFKETKNVRLDQFMVYQPLIDQYDDISKDGEYFKTNTTTSTSNTNTVMDQISRHIVWNMNSCTGRLEIKEGGGMYLQPNYGSETRISATSGGWLVSAGYVYNDNAEWHNFFSELPDSTQINLRALKTVDDKVPKSNAKFTFKLYEFVSGAWETNPMMTQQNVDTNGRATGSVEFTITDDARMTAGWHVYKIVEEETSSSSNYISDGNEYYAVVKVTQVGDKKVASSPEYYRTFNAAQFNASALTASALGMSNRISLITFKNEQRKQGLTLRKVVNGSNSNKVPFTFKIEVWQAASDDYKSSHSGASTMPISLTDEVYNVAGVQGVSTITFKPDTTTNHVSWATIDLKNGQKASIEGLPDGALYKITETHVNGKDITVSTNVDADGYVDGYKPNPEQGNPITGTLNGTAVTFENDYNCKGEVTIEAQKKLYKLSGSSAEISVPENAFGFRLILGRVIDTQYNDDNGHVVFEPVQYTADDMLGATEHPDGTRTKIITYTVEEIDGSVNSVDYNQILNDVPQTITVTLVDDGKGQITATADPADFTVLFNNKEGIQVTLEGSKTLTGRDMELGEVFNFEVTDDENSNNVVSTAYVYGTKDGVPSGFTFTPISYTHEDIGVHHYTIKEVKPSASDDDFIEDVLYDTTEHHVTVTVSQNSNGDLSATIDPSAFVADFTNTSKTSVTVKKVWQGGNPDHLTARLYLLRFKKDAVAQGGGQSQNNENQNQNQNNENQNNENQNQNEEESTGDTVKLTLYAGNNECSSPLRGFDNIDVRKGTTVSIVIQSHDEAPDVRTWTTGGFYYGYDVVNVISEGTVRIDEYNTGNHDLKKYTASVTVDADKNIGVICHDNSPAGFGYTVSADYYPKLSAMAASPYLLAFNPFVALAEGGSAPTLPAGIANGIEIPEGYVLDSEGWRLIQLTHDNLSETVSNLDICDSNGDVYYYAIVEAEVPEDYTVTYNPGGDHPTPVSALDLSQTETVLTATNTTIKEYPGALKLKKLVTIEGKPLDEVGNDKKGLADGDYFFHIQGQAPNTSVDKYVRICIYDGDPLFYEIGTPANYATWRYRDNDNDYWWDGHEETVWFWNDDWSWREDLDGYAIVPNLPEGYYTITEVTPNPRNYPDDVTLSKTKVGNNDFTTVTSASDWSVTVYVAAGQNVIADIAPAATATFVNDRYTCAIKIKKIVENDLVDSIGDTCDGAYDFSITKAGTDEVIKYVRIFIIDGGMANYHICDQLEDLGDDWKNYDEDDNDRWVIIDNLESGDYVIKELGSFAAGPGNMDGTTPLTDMRLKSIVGGKNDANLSEGTITVTADRGTVAAAAMATYTNKKFGLKVPFKAKKTLEGGKIGHNQFEFSLMEYIDEEFKTKKNVNDGGLQDDSEYAAEGSECGDIAFSKYAVYTEPGDHYYAIMEKVPTVNPRTDIVYDTHRQYIKVVVTEDTTSGELTATRYYKTDLQDEWSTTAPEEGYDATFTNKEVSLSLKKIVEAHTNYPVNGDENYTDGDFTFTVVGPEGNDSVTRNVVITTENAKMIGAKLNGVEITSETPGVMFDENNGVRFIGLQPGTYTVTEGDWTPADNTKDYSRIEMYLKELVATSGTVDKTTKTATVTLTGSEEATPFVGVTFTNLLAPNQPVLEKQVTDLNDSSRLPDKDFYEETPFNRSADYDIGDKVPYRVTTFLPSDIYRAHPDYYYYEIEDTMNHLQYDGTTGALVDSDGHYTGSGKMYAFIKSDTEGDVGYWYDVSKWFSVTVGDYTAEKTQTIHVYPTDEHDLTKVTTGKKLKDWGSANTHGDIHPFVEPSFEPDELIPIVNGDIRYLQFRYKAVLQEDALIGPETGNRNTAKLYYWTNDRTHCSNEDHTVVYTYTLQVKKTDNNNNPLAGAEFQLFKKYENSAPQGTWDNSRTFTGGYTLYGLSDNVEILDFAEVTNTSFPGNYYLVPERPQSTETSTSFEWTGIDDGNYILVESKGPRGYEPLSKPLVFNVDTYLKSLVPGFRSGYINVYSTSNASCFTNKTLSDANIRFEAKIPNRPRTKLLIKKVDKEKWPQETVYLDGAEFELKKKITRTTDAGTVVDYVPYSNPTFPNSVYDSQNPVVRTITNKDEGLVFEGLEDGEYRLVETKSPPGYVRLTAVEIDFTVSGDVVTYTGGVYDANDNPACHVVEYTPAKDDDPATFTIGNEPGIALPSTGGTGTSMFYILGSILTLVAAVLLITKKRSDGAGID